MEKVLKYKPNMKAVQVKTRFTGLRASTYVICMYVCMHMRALRFCCNDCERCVDTETLLNQHYLKLKLKSVLAI